MKGPRSNLNRDPPGALRAGIVVRALVTAVLVVCALAAASTRPVVPRPTAHAPDVTDRVRSLVVSVVHGDLPAARVTARMLAEHVEPAAGPTGAPASTARVRDAATAVASATDVAAAAAAMARLVAACGGCHEAAGVTPRLPRPAPSASGSIAGHMMRHQDAADLLLEGLVVPSTAAWTRGAGQLQEAPLRSGDFPVSDRIGTMMSKIETQLHSLAGDAGAATDLPGRVPAYATLLTTCAQCHTQHTTLWPQKVR
jgi:cytochrome c553